MNNPWYKFKSQPWRQLFPAALMTTLSVAIPDLFLQWSYFNSQGWNRSLSLLLSPPLGIVISLAAIFGMGALGVYICERWFPNLILNTASLWALVLCLIVGLFFKSFFPTFLVGFSYSSIICLMLGVFWKGRRYWR